MWFVCDCSVRVCVRSSPSYVSVFTTIDSKFVTSFGRKGTEEGNFNEPFGVNVDGDGYVYVCDGQNDRVQVF